MNIPQADTRGLYLVAKRISVEPHRFLAISHETGCVVAEADVLEELHAVMFAHGWLFEEI